jgi:hypothetical protein
MSSEVLSIYGFKAMTTIGDADDFRHFLPRLFEILVLDEFGYNEETLFRKLDYAGWQNWDHEERATIEDFFVALFRTAVEFGSGNVFLTQSYLIGIACAVSDVTPYLDLWLENITERKIFTLKYFIVDDYYGMYNAFFSDKRDQREQIINWLVSDKVTSLLEYLFFESLEFQGNSDLAQILDAIYELKR